MIIKIRLIRTDLDSGDTQTIHLETSSDMVLHEDSDVYTRINELSAQTADLKTDMTTLISDIEAALAEI